MVWSCCLNFSKGLINVYTIKLIKHKIDRPYGIVSNSIGKIISILFSFFVHLFVKFKSVILS